MLYAPFYQGVHAGRRADHRRQQHVWCRGLDRRQLRQLAVVGRLRRSDDPGRISSSTTTGTRTRSTAVRATNNCYGVDGKAITQPIGRHQGRRLHGRARPGIRAVQPGESGRRGHLPHPRFERALRRLHGLARRDGHDPGRVGLPGSAACRSGQLGQAEAVYVLTKTVDFTPNKVLNVHPEVVQRGVLRRDGHRLRGQPDQGGGRVHAQAVTGRGPTTAAPTSTRSAALTRPVRAASRGTPHFIDLTTDPETGQAAIYVHSSTNAVRRRHGRQPRHPERWHGITRDFDFNPHDRHDVRHEQRHRSDRRPGARRRGGDSGGTNGPAR